MRKSSLDNIYKALLVLWTAESCNKIFTNTYEFQSTVDTKTSTLSSTQFIDNWSNKSGNKIFTD